MVDILVAPRTGPSAFTKWNRLLTLPRLSSIAQPSLPPPNIVLPVLEHLRFPPFFQLRFPPCQLLLHPNLGLNPLPRPQHLALQVKASPFLRIIHIKELLEPLHHIFHIRLPVLRWFDVQDLACFFEGEAVRGEGPGASWVAGFGLRFCVL